MTRNAKAVLELIGYELIDHVIVTDGAQYYSFREHGRILVSVIAGATASLSLET